MATKRIEKNDLIAPDAITGTIKEVQALNAALTTVLKTQQQLLKQNPFKSGADVKNFNESLNTTKATSKALTAVRKEELALQKQLKAASDAEVKGKIRLQQASKAQKDELKDLLVLENKEAGTLDRLAASNRKLRRERQGLNLDTAKGTKRLQQINSQLDKNNVRIKTNSDALKKQRMNVGNYSAGVQEGITATGLFSKQLFILQRIQAVVTLLTKKQTEQTVALAGAQTVAAKSTGGMSKAMGVLKIALISTGIGLIVIALGALIAAFASTQRGADALTRVITPLKVVFETFIGFIQDTSFKVFDRLKEAINDPAQAFKDLGEVIVNNITNRFEAIIELGGAVGKVLKGLVSGNFDKVGEGLEDAANASIKLATGLDDVVGSLKELAKETSEATSKALADGKKLANLEIGLEKLRVRNTVPLAAATLEYNKQKALASDLIKSDKDRLDSLNKAKIALDEANEMRKQEIRTELAIAELKASFNDTDIEAQLEIEEIKARILLSDAEAEKKKMSLISLGSGIEKRQLTEREKSNKDLIKLSEESTTVRISQDKKELDSFVENRKKEAEASEKANKAIEEDNKKKAESETKRQKEQIEQVKQAVALSGDAISQLSEKKIQNIEREEDKTEKSIERAERRAEQGLENDLAFQQKKAAELEQRREEEAEKQENIAKGLAFVNLVADFAKDDANSAVPKGIATMAIMETALALFEDGAERIGDKTGHGGANLPGRDNVIIGAHTDERIFGIDQSNKIRSKLGNISNDDLVELATNNNQVGYSIGMNTSNLEAKLDRVEKAVRESGMQINWDAHDNRIETKIENGVKKRTIYTAKRI